MKSFERLVLNHLKDVTGPLLDLLPFAYRANRSVDDAVNMGLHYILHRLDTIAPDILQQKLIQLAVPASTCQWITSFLTNRRQRVRLGGITSDTGTTNTGAPQWCVLSPLLFSLYANNFSSGDSAVKLLKYADDTTLIGLIQDGDETRYRQEVERLVHWCSQNHLELNPLKTVEPEEGPAEAVLPETAQEVQPAARASEDLLHCHHPVCPLHLHHCLVWIGRQTRQAQTATDNQDCRKDNWNQPPIYPRLVPVQDQETCKEHLYRPFSPRLQSV
ncbi:uncharacterized protein LOC133159889 [Syngnathus typhle]|uniref:uncharacterized protein LOC133159889 n=1 Tax=Syngnathus typhle TaxID=161592 RepID=UPI002A6AF76A|nr:uncharacterized protein LOC133159889 [Syngnathus typhle]